MRMPLAPRYCVQQRYLNRFWRTEDMLEILSIYYGIAAEAYPRTWHYRTLIAVHRAQHSTNAYGKGYGPDWKCIKKEKDSDGEWTGRWLQDNGIAIKHEVLEYAKKGRLPLSALEFAAKHIREAELRAWVIKRAQAMADASLLLAAE